MLHHNAFRGLGIACPSIQISSSKTDQKVFILVLSFIIYKTTIFKCTKAFVAPLYTYYYFLFYNCFSNSRIFKFLLYNSSKPTPITYRQYLDRSISLLSATCSKKSFNLDSHLKQIDVSIFTVMLYHQSNTFSPKKKWGNGTPPFSR